MRKHKRCLGFFLAIAICFFHYTAVLAEEKTNAMPADRVDWYRAYFPPVTIPSGPDAGQGFFDRVNAFLIQRLPEYEHNYRTANFKRIIAEIKKGRSACCPSLYKNKEREQYVAFSVPAVVVLPNAIITRKNTVDKMMPYITAENKLKLSELLQNQNLTLGISNGRVYSGGIDEILKRFEGARNIFVRSGEDVFKGLLTMLFLGRVDYILGYPTEAVYFAKKQSRTIELISYPIAENQIAFTVGHIGCPKTEWGMQLIASIDEILLEHRHTEAFLGFYEYWLDEESIPLYRKIAQEFFLQDTR